MTHGLPGRRGIAAGDRPPAGRDGRPWRRSWSPAGRSTPSARSTYSHFSVMISFSRQPVRISSRTAAIAEGSSSPSALHLAQHLADAAQLGGAQEPLALLLPVLLDVLARVGAVRPQAPQLGEIEHLREDLQAAVGLIGDVPVLVVEAGDLLAAHLGDRPVAEEGQDELLEAPSVFLLRRGLQVHGDVLGVEPRGEVLHRHRVAAGVALGQRIDRLGAGRRGAGSPIPRACSGVTTLT